MLRASDADRDAVVDRLRVAGGEGRLEPDELEQRVDGALHARTYGDLAELLADLPGDDPTGSRRAGRRIDVGRPVAVGVALLVAVTVAVAVVALLAMLVIAAAAWWIGVVLFWLVCRGSRRRLAWRPAGRRSLTPRHVGPSGR